VGGNSLCAFDDSHRELPGTVVGGGRGARDNLSTVEESAVSAKKWDLQKVFIPSHRLEALRSSKLGLELARGIEPPTCGLQTITDPPSDNVTPQETTDPDSADMGQDGASLPCPGSSMVAKEGE
jgi:hypothetical protein